MSSKYNEDGIVEQEEEYEYVLTTGLLSFPSSTKLLLNDSIAVADTGSRANLSGSKQGATNIIQTTYGNNNNHSTQDASGRDLQVKMIYDLNFMFTDRYGKDKLKATVTRMASSGWKCKCR
jgi:hypothetical protein